VRGSASRWSPPTRSARSLMPIARDGHARGAGPTRCGSSAKTARRADAGVRDARWDQRRAGAGAQAGEARPARRRQGQPDRVQPDSGASLPPLAEAGCRSSCGSSPRRAFVGTVAAPRQDAFAACGQLAFLHVVETGPLRGGPRRGPEAAQEVGVGLEAESFFRSASTASTALIVESARRSRWPGSPSFSTSPPLRRAGLVECRCRGRRASSNSAVEHDLGVPGPLELLEDDLAILEPVSTRHEAMIVPGAALLAAPCGAEEAARVLERARVDAPSGSCRSRAARRCSPRQAGQRIEQDSATSWPDSTSRFARSSRSRRRTRGCAPSRPNSTR